MLNKKKSFISLVVLFMWANLASASQVDVDFKRGDTLTEGKMNNIKSAVNSKQNLVTESCPKNQFIREIFAGGTVECVGSGAVTSVTAGHGLTGGGDSGAVNLSLTGAVSIHGSQFISLVPHHNDVFRSSSNGIKNVGLLETAAYANVNLPHGVAPDSLRCRISNPSVSSQLRVQVRRLSLIQQVNAVTVFDINFVGANPSDQFIVDSTFDGTTIDNVNNAYIMIVDLPVDARLRGCSISY